MSGPPSISPTLPNFAAQTPIFYPAAIHSDKSDKDAEEEERALVSSLPVPLWVEPLRMEKEIVAFQAECKNPELKSLIDEVVRLKQADVEHTQKELQFKKMIEAYAIPLLRLVQHDLYKLIH